MALLSTKGEVPKGAVKLTTNEAFQYQWNQIYDWPNFWDVWPFKVGIPLLTGLATISSLRINTYVRGKLKLLHYGLRTSQFTVGIAAITVAGSAHHWFVTRNIMTYNATCLICTETKSIAIQVAGAVIYPCIMSPLANFVLSIRYGTYQLPNYDEYRGIAKFWIELMRPLQKKLSTHIIVNIIAVSIITYAENESLYTVRRKLLERAIQEFEDGAKIESS